jgi:hypothetical protein
VELACLEDQHRRTFEKNEQLSATVDKLKVDRERADHAIRQLESIVQKLKVVFTKAGPCRAGRTRDRHVE